MGRFDVVDEFLCRHGRPGGGRLVGVDGELGDHCFDVEALAGAGFGDRARAAAAVVEAMTLELAGQRGVGGDEVTESAL